MLVNKGDTGCWGLFEKREVRYQVPKKVGFRGDEVVSLQQWMKKLGFQLCELLTPKGMSFGDTNTSSLFLLLPITSFLGHEVGHPQEDSPQA